MKKQRSLSAIMTILLLSAGVFSAQAETPTSPEKFNFQLNSIKCAGAASPIFDLSPESQQTLQAIDASLLNFLLKEKGGYLGGHTVVAQPYGKMVQLRDPLEDALIVTVVTSRAEKDILSPFAITKIVLGGSIKGFALAQHGLRIDANTGTMTSGPDLSCDISVK